MSEFAIKKMPPIHGIRDIPVLTPNFYAVVNGKEKATYAEPTGKGNLLIVEGFFGRMFRSSEECVRRELKEFSEKNDYYCRLNDEDPRHEFYEVLSWNDLYELHGLIPTYGGNLWGYTNSEDYRTDILWDIEMVTSGMWAEQFGEPFLLYSPREGSYPMECYLEV